MILETIVGIALNVIASDSATGNNLMKGVMTYNKIYKMEKEGTIDDSIHEETYQILKDSIIELGQK